MRPTHRLRAPSTALAALLIVGCSSDSGPGTDAGAPMGWIPKQDEQTGVGFALPPPTAGPDERRRPGRTTPVATRAYTARAGEIAFSVQFVSTPERPASLPRELPLRRMPALAVDQVQAEADYEAQVLTNAPVEGAEHPTYDARMELASDQEEALWWMRTQALDDVLLVTQVVVFVESASDEERAELERRGETAFERLNETVAVPGEMAR